MSQTMTQPRLLQRGLMMMANRTRTSNLALSSQATDKKVRIGCSSGFWGDTPTAVPQLVYGGNIKYLVSDYLSEVTMSLLVAVKNKNPQFGFTPDFVESIAPHLKEIKRQGIRIVTNGGGMNPKACVAMLQNLSNKAGVKFSIADVTGDDLMGQMGSLKDADIRDMFHGKPFPPSVNSMNAYYGAGPVVNALDRGAEIVVTGRVTDSALALAPLIHEFGWGSDQFDQLAAGSLAGHLIECGAQATGGNHTDWESIEGFDRLGFPIAEVSSDGDMLITKPPGTGGKVTVGTVAEQMLYEIGDGQNYLLPDVVADFSKVKMSQAEGGVHVTGALGRPPSDNFKISATHMDGFKATCVVNFCGGDASKKARVTAEATFKRTRDLFGKLGLPDFEKTHVQVLGTEESFGGRARSDHLPREAVLWMAVKHQDKKALQLWAKEIAAAGTGGTPGITAVVGGRPKPTPCLKLYSFLYPKSKMPATICLDGVEETYTSQTFPPQPVPSLDIPEVSQLLTGSNNIKLNDLAFTRSGDKGDSCNIGVIARDPAYLPYLRSRLTEEAVGTHFQHVFEESPSVKRFDLPGVHALNFVLAKSLGGGGIASLRPDPQGKAYGQILADFFLENMPSIEEIKNAATH